MLTLVIKLVITFYFSSINEYINSIIEEKSFIGFYNINLNLT